MGYETKLYLVMKYLPGARKVISLSEGNASFHLFSDENHSDKGVFYYLGDTKKYISELNPREYEIIDIDVCEKIAFIDLCNAYTPAFSELGSYKSSYGAFYGGDGDSLICKDGYGSYMNLIPAKKVLEALEKDYIQAKYRRYNMAISLLKSALASFSESEELFVLLFGH